MSLPDLFDVATLDEPYPAYDRLRAESPVWQVPGTRTYLVLSWDLVVEATARAEDFSSNLTALLITGPDGRPVEFDMTPRGTAIHVLATADDPEHATHRRLTFPHLVPGKVDAMADELRVLTRRLWDDGLDDGRIEWMSALADRLPLTVVARLLGFPDTDVPQLLRWAYNGTELLSGVASIERMIELSADADAMGTYLAARYAEALEDPGPTLLGDLARAARDGALRDDEVVAMLIQLVGAGGESTAGLIGNAVRRLADDPELQARVRADLGLVPRLIEETLRLESPFRGHYRAVRRDTTLGGVALGPGDHLVLHWGAANRDPGEHVDPALLDLDRTTRSSHLAFGRGLHFCIGAPLARLEARIALEQILTRTRAFTLDPERPPVWVQSIFVRRHAVLPLALQPA